MNRNNKVINCFKRVHIIEQRYGSLSFAMPVMIARSVSPKAQINGLVDQNKTRFHFHESSIDQQSTVCDSRLLVRSVLERDSIDTSRAVRSGWRSLHPPRSANVQMSARSRRNSRNLRNMQSHLGNRFRHVLMRKQPSGKLTSK
jgi:hypothetical protein